jgi:hypothetical protein
MMKIAAIIFCLLSLNTGLKANAIQSVLIKKAEKIAAKFFDQNAYFQAYETVYSFVKPENINLYLIKNEDNHLLGMAAIVVANGCVVGGCSATNKNETRYEQFYFLSVYNSNKELVLLSVLDYPGEYGFEISSKWWLKQFLEKPSKEYHYRQNIDAISGATVSAQSVVSEINKLNSHIKKISY